MLKNIREHSAEQSCDHKIIIIYVKINGDIMAMILFRSSNCLNGYMYNNNEVIIDNVIAYNKEGIR